MMGPDDTPFLTRAVGGEVGPVAMSHLPPLRLRGGRLWCLTRLLGTKGFPGIGYRVKGRRSVMKIERGCRGRKQREEFDLTNKYSHRPATQQLGSLLHVSVSGKKR